MMDMNKEDGVYSQIENYSAEWSGQLTQPLNTGAMFPVSTFVKVDDNEHMCGDIRVALSSG
jgi:hypothetical protein